MYSSFSLTEFFMILVSGDRLELLKNNEGCSLPPQHDSGDSSFSWIWILCRGMLGQSGDDGKDLQRLKIL